MRSMARSCLNLCFPNKRVLIIVHAINERRRNKPWKRFYRGTCEFPVQRRPNRIQQWVYVRVVPTTIHHQMTNLHQWIGDLAGPEAISHILGSLVLFCS
jgi:hypothetical protein